MLNDVKIWFQNYTKNFYSDDPGYNRNILLKAAHSIRVSRLAQDIAVHENFSSGNQEFARVMGLLHDIGRFEQYRHYHTFDDAKSINHGKRGAEILHQVPILKSLPPNDRDCISNVTHFHNCILIPQNLDTRTLNFLRLIRDADKLDILNISQNYFANRTPENKNRVLELHVQDGEEINDKIYHSILDGKLVGKQDVKTLNDFKALLLSWVFDLNYQRSFKILYRNNAIQKLYATISKGSSRSQNIFHRIMEFFEHKLSHDHDLRIKCT